MSDPKSVPSLPEPPPEEFPRRFGHYTLLAPLARGGMGEVFLAKTGGVAGLEKRCVVKTLRPHLTDDREYVARFVDEARIVVQLGHHNICQVFDVGTVGERYYLAMEYIAGRDVKTLQGRVDGGTLDRGIAIFIMGEVLEALDYAHRHVDAATGQPLLLVHRDISPQNVMLSFEGEVKLIDFGLAASTMKLEQTQPNVVMGKLAYMAPEQVRGDKVDGRVDLFAVAVCLYELLVGERFYEGRSPYEIWGIAAQGGFRPRKWDELPPVLRAVLDRALAAEPSARFATALEMRSALEAYRFENGLRGDSPALREQMQQLFVPEIEENRRLLQLLATVKPGADSGPLSPVTQDERTLSIARALSGPTVHKDATEPTQMMVAKAFGAERRTRRMAALASLALLSGVIAFVTRDAVRAALKPAPLAALVVDAGPTPVPPPLDPAPPPALDPAPPPPALDPSPPTPPLPGPGEQEPRKRPSKSVDGRKKPDPAPPVEVRPEQPPTEVVVRPPPPSYESVSNKGKRIQLLKQHCSAPCVSAVARAYGSNEWAVSQESADAFIAALRTCWVTTCRLPP